MELDVKTPPQVACTDDQLLQLDEARRSFARVEARMAEIGGVFDELTALIDALAAHVGEIRRLRAVGLGAPAADQPAPLREVEWVFGRVSAQVRRVAALRGSIVEMGRACVGPCCGGEAVDMDAQAAGLQRIHINLSK